MKECAKCGARITEDHIVHNEHYCSRDCAIEALTDDIIMNAKEAAIEDYDEHVSIERHDVTRCKHCSKPLALNETAWASRDGMFCSYDCGVKDAYNMYEEHEITNAEERMLCAAKYFEGLAEEISREDYGADVIHYTTYINTLNMTLIFEKVSENGVEVSRELVGWTYGRVRPSLIQNYVGKLKHVCID